VDLLINRFHKKVLYFQADVQIIFGLKGVEEGSTKGHGELSDFMNSHFRVIRTLANKYCAYFLFISSLTSMIILPVRSGKKICQSMSSLPGLLWSHFWRRGAE